MHGVHLVWLSPCQLSLNIVFRHGLSFDVVPFGLLCLSTMGKIKLRLSVGIKPTIPNNIIVAEPREPMQCEVKGSA